MITPSPTAPAGAVSTLPRYDAASFRPRCTTCGGGPTVDHTVCIECKGREMSYPAILCRTNAPLVAMAFSLIRRDVPVRILGRDLGAGLTKVIKASKASDMTTLRDKLSAWHGREIKKCRTAKQRDALDDKYSCLVTITETEASPEAVLRTIDRLFVSDSSGPAAVTLATGHKAKGLEWSSVFILDRGLCPSRWASGTRELEQERNLMYVMVTRARDSVTYIASNNWK